MISEKKIRANAGNEVRRDMGESTRLRILRAAFQKRME